MQRLIIIVLSVALFTSLDYLSHEIWRMVMAKRSRRASQRGSSR